MLPLIQALQRNPIFKFFSSVRLAVPLMLVIAGVVAAGTLYESRYNAEVANLIVYKSWWFFGLMILLWMNIFCAAVSRIPYKMHHTGFVITHIGLLTLLIGGEITATSGIDGQLRVLEGQNSSTVVLQDLVIRARSEKGLNFETDLKRSLDEKNASSLEFKDLQNGLGISLEHYFPFVEVTQVADPNGGAATGAGATGSKTISFKLKSQFFDVSESLNTEDKSTLQMGPATLRLIQQKPKAVAAQSPARKRGASSKDRILVIRDAKSGQELKSITLTELKKSPVTVKGTKVTLTKSYEEAVVAQNKLAESGTPGANPALELRVEAGGKSVREVAYAKFKQFSLNRDGAFGLRFDFNADSASGASEQESSSNAVGTTPGLPASGNVIDFYLVSDSEAEVHLSKNGQEVLKKRVKAGEMVQTPWMGMQITLESIGASGSMIDKVTPIDLPPKTNLPPSAVLIRTDLPNASGDWVIEGQAKTLMTQRGPVEFYYGPKTVETPFKVNLIEFRKKDYPGTQTALSFESTIKLNESGAAQIIQMNEPLSEQGYLLYQSSYEMGPGIPTASIFSVNKDPGRFTKYVGAVILCLGIVIFTLMRSKWYQNRKKGKAMTSKLATALLILGITTSQAQAQEPLKALNPEAAQSEITRFGKQIKTDEIEALPVQSHGRVKPLTSFTREIVLYLTGKYSYFGLDSTQLYLALTLSDSAPYAPVINIRDPDLRVQLGFTKESRYVSLQQLSASPLEDLSKPLMEKEEKNPRSLSPDDKKVIEVQQQFWLLREMITGGHIRQAALLDGGSGSGAHAESAGILMEKANTYLDSLKRNDFGGATRAAIEWISTSKTQTMPDLFREQLPRIGTELFYLKLRPFLWSGLIYFLLGIAFMMGMLKGKRKNLGIVSVVGAMVLHILGFGMRVYITGFAPVTNMYGTMIWMSFGVVIFGLFLFLLYQQNVALGLLLVGSGLTLLLTESIPLILSPDMDPIVAVLRNNFWLSTHVLTISISYAAFTIAMLLGNAALVMTLLGKLSQDTLKQFSHIAYRAIQLGVFLLTTGIILGGWWADYSWGRFWGWDPKETWALIADIGFLAILHARYVGWLKDFGILAAAPLSYLLVIMAWYGVNFILAAGLHSYGFSSGGATIVVSFVTVQMILFTAAMVRAKQRRIGA